MEKEPKYIIEEKLPKQRAEEIVKKFKEKGCAIEVDGEHFIIHAEKDGKKFDQLFPQWKFIPREDGSRVKIEDDIQGFLNSLEKK